MNTAIESIRNEKPTHFVFTDRAAAYVTNTVSLKGNADLKLRVYVDVGGCSGFKYVFAFEEIINDDDKIIINNSASIIIDSISYKCLIGAEIDYKDDLAGAELFINKNPGSTSTCGCGSSFSA